MGNAEQTSWAILCSKAQLDHSFTPGAERFWNRSEEKEGGKTYMVPKVTPFSRESMYICGRLLITPGKRHQPGYKGRPQENGLCAYTSNTPTS